MPSLKHLLNQSRAILGLVAAILVSSASHASSVGILAVFKQKHGHIHESLAHHGCAVWRAGTIGKFRGEFDIKGASHFALLECQGSMLATPATRSVLEEALGIKSGGLLFEGDFLTKEQNFASDADAKDRRYVIKIGRFNNKDVTARQTGSIGFFEAAKASPNVFDIEARFIAARAVGTQTPDTVEVFYYKDIATGAMFSKDSAALIKESHKFNAAHFEEFIYFGAAVVPRETAPVAGGK